jgi:hypothetical protein
MLKNLTKEISRSFKIKSEKGATLLLVLILVLFAILIVSPLLAFTSTGLRTGQSFENRTGELYAADAGVQSAIWEIKYGNIQNLTNPAPYNEYDYFRIWPDTMMPATVNNKPVAVTIQNVWIPRGPSIPDPPTAADAEAIQNNGRLIVTGSTVALNINDNGNFISQYEIRITYYPGSDEPSTGNSNLKLNYVGIWLPQGFKYYSSASYKSSPESLSTPCAPFASSFGGNEARIWYFNTPVPFSSFPSVNRQNFPWEADIYFYFQSTTPYEPYLKPDALSWVMTSGEEANDLSYTWDADTKVCKVISTSGNTTNETYITRTEGRKLTAAINGDYYATGNALQVYPNSTSVYRSQANSPSSAPVTSSNIPTDADVTAAFLYWSGWKNNSAVTTRINGNTSNFTYAGTPWTTSGTTTFRGNTSSGSGDLTLTNALALGSISSGGAVLSWNQSVYPGYSDGCSSITTGWSRTGSAWSQGNGYFQAQNGTAANYLTRSASTDISSYAGNPITVSWDQWVSGTTGATDILSFDLSSDGGATWGNHTIALSGDTAGSVPLRYSYTIPATYVASGFRIRFTIAGFASPAYCNIDNITIAPSYASDRGLYFSFSTDNGTTWSAYIQSYRGNTQGNANYSYTIPDVYLKDNFKVRFHLVGYSATGQYFTLDNIRLTTMSFTNTCAFYIDPGTGRQQVYLDASGLPQAGAQPLTPTRTQVMRDNVGTNPDGFSYSCFRDVTALVRRYSQQPVPPATNIPGYATYWAGSVDSDGVGSGLDQIAYSGWSLIIVYTSPATLGHQLYLYDKFIYSNHDSRNGVNVDFDGDGKPGGTISGFIVPPPVVDQYGNITEVNAAKITCFVGEGDPFYTGDYLAISRADGSAWTKLWDGTNTTDNSVSNPDNVWNSTTRGLTNTGIDIDTLGLDPTNGQYITWASNILRQGNSSVHIDMVTHEDVWNMVYIIFSFRSATSTGGQRNFLIR